MSARIIILIFMILRMVYSGWYTYLEITQRKKPLPESVSDIYDEDRYQKFIDRETDINKLYYLHSIVDFIFEVIILFSPIFTIIDKVCNGNIYYIFILTYLIYTLWSIATGFVYEHYFTFVIDEKYGLNKETTKSFIKDFVRDTIVSIASGLLIYLLIIYCAEHMVNWTSNFSMGWTDIAGLCSAIVFVFAVVILGISLLSIFNLKRKYTFTKLPEGELRTKITDMLKGAKKVKDIYVYDESKKSVRKNAFLLRFLWHREFGIADNFLDENSERELLAVLSHEIGHLKHKKNWKNYAKYLLIIFIVLLLSVFMHDPSSLLKINSWVSASFNISSSNYYIYLNIYSLLLKPILFVSSVFTNYVSRTEEYEADMEAVKNGYGEELIATFKTLSSDELIDIHPNPIIEFIEYDHPSMYRRIEAIRERKVAPNI